MNIYVTKNAEFFRNFSFVINSTFGCSLRLVYNLKHGGTFPVRKQQSFLVLLFCFLFGFLCARTTFIREAGKQIRHDDR